MPTAVEQKLAPMTAHSDFFLELGDIKGESKDDQHKGKIDLISFKFGVRQPGGSGAIGGGAGVGKAQFHEFQITKLMDSASAKLMLACATGQHFKEATLFCRKAGGTQMEYLQVKLENVLVSGYESSGGEEGLRDSLPVDRFQLNFAKIHFNYKAQNPDGTAGPNTMTAYDLMANKKM